MSHAFLDRPSLAANLLIVPMVEKSRMRIGALRLVWPDCFTPVPRGATENGLGGPTARESTILVNTSRLIAGNRR